MNILWQSDNLERPFSHLVNLHVYMYKSTCICYYTYREQRCRVVKLLAWGARGPGFDSRSRHLNFHLLPDRDMAEIPPKRRKSSIQPTNQLYLYANRLLTWIWEGGNAKIMKMYQFWYKIECSIFSIDQTLGSNKGAKMSKTFRRLTDQSLQSVPYRLYQPK